MKSFGHQASFIAFNGTIGITLNQIYPFASNDIASSVRRNKIPCLIFEQGIKLEIHGSVDVEETVPSSRVLLGRVEGGGEICEGRDSEWGKGDEGWANNCGLASVSEWACGDSLWAEEVSLSHRERGCCVKPSRGLYLKRT